MTNPLIIDISHWQSNVNFAGLKAAGTIGVFLKATQGTTGVDNTFASRNQAARAAGLCVATYHYLTKGSIAQQMQFYVNTVKPASGDRLVIDFEEKNLTLDDLELAVKTLIDIAPDREITVYGANGILGAVLKGKRNDLLANNTSLWVASYTTATEPTTTLLDATWPLWTVWQYSDKGKVDGVIGNCDVNRFNGPNANIPGWFHRPAGQPAPTPPAPEPVEQNPVSSVEVGVNIVAPKGVTLKVTVNGEPT